MGRTPFRIILVQFMSFRDNVPYPDDALFSESQLRTVTPADICRWMNFRAYGDPMPGRDSIILPLRVRPGTLGNIRSAVSTFMPDKGLPWDPVTGRGDPTRAEEVDELVAAVKAHAAASRPAVPPSPAPNVSPPTAPSRIINNGTTLNLDRIPPGPQAPRSRVATPDRALQPLPLNGSEEATTTTPTTTTWRVMPPPQQSPSAPIARPAAVVDAPGGASSAPTGVNPETTEWMRREFIALHKHMSEVNHAITDVLDEIRRLESSTKREMRRLSVEVGRLAVLAPDHLHQPAPQHTTAESLDELTVSLNQPMPPGDLAHDDPSNQENVTRNMSDDDEELDQAIDTVARGVPTSIGPPVLSKRPRDLYQLWHEYAVGDERCKAAKDFTTQDRGANKYNYSRRKLFWDVIVRHVRAGYSAESAIDRVYSVYGRHLSVSSILVALRRDRQNGGNPALMC